MNTEDPHPPDTPPEVDPVEVALRFLEADPRYGGADAVKQRAAAALRCAPLSPEQRDRAAALVLRALRHGGDDVFRAYAHLAPRVTSPLFEAAVTCYAASCEVPVFERAEYVLSVLRPARPGTRTRARPHRAAPRLQCAGQME